MTPPPPKGKKPAPVEGEASDEEVRPNAISDLLEVRADESRSQGPVDLSSFEAQLVTEPVRSPEASTFDGLPEDSSSKNAVKTEPDPSPVVTRSGETVADVKSDVEDLIDLRTVPPAEGHGAPAETKQNVSESDTSIKVEAPGNESPRNRGRAQSTTPDSTTRSTAEREDGPDETGSSSNADDEASKAIEDTSRKIQAMMVDRVMSSFTNWLDVRLKVKKEEQATPRPPARAPQPHLSQIGAASRLPRSRPVSSGAPAARTNALDTAFPPAAPPAAITSNRFHRSSGALYGSSSFSSQQQRQQPAFQALDDTLGPERSYAPLGKWDQFDSDMYYSQHLPAGQAQQPQAGPSGYMSFTDPLPALSAPTPPLPPPPPAAPRMVSQSPQLPSGNALPKRSNPSEDRKSPPQTQYSTSGLDVIDADGRSEHSDIDGHQPAPPPAAKSGFLPDFLKSRKEKKTRTLLGSPAESEAAAPPTRARRKAAAVYSPPAALGTDTAATWPASSSSGTVATGQQAAPTKRAGGVVAHHPGPAPKGTKGRTRNRQYEEEGGEDGDGGVPPHAKMLRVQQDEISGAKLACPFFKHNPRKYKNQRPCCGPGWDHVHRIKEHIYRKHSLPKFSCPRCNQPFETQSALQDHARSPDPCEVREPEVQDGITQDQEKKLRSRKKTTAKGGELTEAEKWTHVYKILFPDVREREIPSPHYTTEDAQTNLGGYEDYLRRELPPLVRRQLEKEVERELGLMEMEDGMKHKVIEIARNLQLALFRGYQQLENQEKSGNGDGSSPDDVSTSEAGPSSSSSVLATTDTSPSTMTTEGTTPEVPDPLDIFTNDPTIPDFDFDFLSEVPYPGVPFPEVPYPAAEDLSKEPGLDVAFGFPYDAQGPPAFQGTRMEAFSGPQVDMPFHGMEPYGDSQSKVIDTRLLSYAP